MKNICNYFNNVVMTITRITIFIIIGILLCLNYENVQIDKSSELVVVMETVIRIVTTFTIAALLLKQWNNLTLDFVGIDIGESISIKQKHEKIINKGLLFLIQVTILLFVTSLCESALYFYSKELIMNYTNISIVLNTIYNFAFFYILNIMIYFAIITRIISIRNCLNSKISLIIFFCSIPTILVFLINITQVKMLLMIILIVIYFWIRNRFETQYNETVYIVLEKDNMKISYPINNFLEKYKIKECDYEKLTVSVENSNLGDAQDDLNNEMVDADND